MQILKIKVQKGEVVQKMERKQTDRQTLAIAMLRLTLARSVLTSVLAPSYLGPERVLAVPVLPPGQLV